MKSEIKFVTLQVEESDLKLLLELVQTQLKFLRIIHDSLCSKEERPKELKLRAKRYTLGRVVLDNAKLSRVSYDIACALGLVSNALGQKSAVPRGGGVVAPQIAQSAAQARAVS